MGKSFLDATGSYSEPRETDNRYLRADGRYEAPDREYLFLDSYGRYSETDVDEDFCYSVYIDDGGNYSSGQNCGIFCLYFGFKADGKDDRYGSRLCRYG